MNEPVSEAFRPTALDRELIESLDALEADALRRRLRVVEPLGPLARIGDRPLINLAGNDYLALSGHPRIAHAVAQAAFDDRSGHPGPQQHFLRPLQVAQRGGEAPGLEGRIECAERGEAEFGLRMAIGAAITTLPQAQQQAIELAYYEGLSHNEIAARLNQPLGTVKTRIKLGMAKLRDSLRHCWDQGDLG